MTQKFGSLVFVFILLLSWAAQPALAQDDPPPPGPVFLVISLNPATFSVDGIKAKGKQSGSDTIGVLVGFMSSGGTATTDTTFTPDTDLTTFPLPVIDKDGNFLDVEELKTHELTIFGSFEIYQSGVLEPHMVTTTSASINTAIQAAFVEAAADLQDAIAADPFMTTGQLSDIVHKHIPSNSGITLSDVASALFNTEDTLAYVADPNPNSTEDVPLVEADGGLLPHAPGSGVLFTFSFSIDNNAKFSADYCRVVPLSVTENAVDLKKQGVLPVVVLSQPGFDPGDVDVSTVTILGVSPSSDSLSDQNGDGVADLTLKFSVSALVSGGLSKTTKSIELDGFLDDGTCIIGTSPINTK